MCLASRPFPLIHKLNVAFCAAPLCPFVPEQLERPQLVWWDLAFHGVHLCAALLDIGVVALARGLFDAIVGSKQP